MKDQFKKELASLLELDEQAICEENPIMASEWDSFVVLCVIALFDKHFDIKISQSQLLACQNFSDLFSLAGVSIVNH